jgi:serine/threonine protein kinase
MGLDAGTRLGPYEIAGRLGAGGMGEVYRARDTRIDRTVAIKILAAGFGNDSAARERFDREARAISQLDHPHICALHDVGSQDGLAFLVMQFVEGETLASRLTRGPMPLDEAGPVAQQIADALEAAHERGIVHRDLKPANVMVTPTGAVKVLDFGLAKDDASTSNLSMSPTVLGATGAGVILGTAAYMSPEQARGKALDKRSDIWAFGCVLYDFWRDGSYSHCGVDAFDLIKVDGQWRIAGGMYTVEAACEPSPLGPLKP